MSADQAQLRAGGLVPTSAKLGADDAVDVVVARAYRHAVVPGRTVIRLTAANIAAGDDLEMATLGFGPGEHRGEVAKERKRPLGFPGWALVHDPKNARYALDVVKEMKKHARRAKSKPGHAKDGFDAIAEKLGKTVPQFLPSFYEEAGRAFIEHGAPSFAAAMFGKAREAEAVHALEVDEQHRVDGFLEFALAGAVSTKSLTQYAKELAEHHKPEVAYAHFRQLCVHRTLGGMPPWSGMAKELRRLAKAAKRNVEDEDRAFIREIIESPALGKAAGEFWRAYAGPITELAKASPSARGALLNLFPTGSTSSADLDETWLDLVDATGAVQGLISGDAPPEARPSGGRAAWFDKLVIHLSRHWRDRNVGDRAFALLRRMAPMLIADGASITCTARYHRIDLDLCELALELAVPVAPTAEHARIDLDRWAKRATEPGHGCDPVRTAAHPVMGPKLALAVATEIGDEPFDAVSRGKRGLVAAKRAWLEGVIADAEKGALVGLGEAIALVQTKVKAETFSDVPDLHARFAALDPVPALARSLRTGIIDELGWPALEEADRELSPDGMTEISVHGGPPAAVLVTKTRMIAVGPTGRLGVHDLVLPLKHELVTARFIGGQFLVVIKSGYKVRGYWSGSPHDVFDSEASVWGIVPLAARAAVSADGAWFEGTRPIRVGDRRIPEGQALAAYDGVTAWTAEWKDGQHRWRELSATGEPGRYSWPSFIEGDADPDWRIDAVASYLLPVPGVTSSPLGIANGLAGTRVRYRGGSEHKQAERMVETIDGKRHVATAAPWPHHLLTLPGLATPRPVADETQYRVGVTSTILDPDGVRGSQVGFADRRYCLGQVAPLPPTFWHAMVTRDEAGSRKLHAITDHEARALIALVPVQGAAIVPGSRVDNAAIMAVLPEVTDPRLHNGVFGLAMIAAQQKADLDRLAADRAPGAVVAKDAAQPGQDDATLIAALSGWIERTYSQDGRAWTQLERVAELFGSTDHRDRYVHDVAPSTLDWMTFAVARSSLAWIALAIGTPAESRKPLGELFAKIVESLPPADKLRSYHANGTLGISGGGVGFRIYWHRGNAYAVRKMGWGGDTHQVLEYAPDGAFQPLPGLTIDQELRGRPGLGADDARTLLAAIADGKTSWSEEAPDRLAALTGLTRSESAFLWAGCPNASDQSANFLDKDLREQLGLKAAQAQIARDGMNAIPLAKRLAVIDETARVGVPALLDGSGVDALAAAWKRLIGARVAVPEELVAEADRQLHAPIAPATALAMFAAGADAPELSGDGIWALGKTGDVIRVSRSEPLVGQDQAASDAAVFTDQVLHTANAYLPFLYAELPVGHELRHKAALAYDLISSRLANPSLWCEAGHLYMDEATSKALDRTLDSFGGEVLAGFDDGITGRHAPGAVVVRNHMRAALKLRPAMIDAKARVLIGPLATQISQWGHSVWKSLEYVRSPGLAQIVARIRSTPVPAGGWEQNPLASAPQLVDRVATHLGVSKDAAALYLQYLALLLPTAKHLQRWNAWKPKHLEAATRELFDKELILEAKRERAQRSHFLPGGWEALKAPDTPMETWKAPMYGARNAEGRLVAPLGRFLALAPFHVLFEVAWERIESGDVPRYDEVKR
ncbi:MAG: hypothetical protein JWP01_728 [Myxococcales bacterium]|nr:hypothetical protein [Myxococcales bacterium]